MRNMAMDLVRKSAKQASAKLKFCRIAFGAAGSAGAIIDMGEAGDVARAFVGEEKIKLDWQVPRENRPKQQVKLLLNMMLIAMGAIPRGGVVKAEVVEGGFSVRATGEGRRRIRLDIGAYLSQRFLSQRARTFNPGKREVTLWIESVV